MFTIATFIFQYHHKSFFHGKEFFSLLLPNPITLFKFSPHFCSFSLGFWEIKELSCLPIYLYWSKGSKIQSALFKKLLFHESVHHLVLPISQTVPQMWNWACKATLVSSSNDFCFFHFWLLALTFSDGIRAGFGEEMPGTHWPWPEKPPSVTRLLY